MNKFIISASFFVVTSLHILLFLYYRNTPIITSLPNISTPTIQFQLTKINEVEKQIEEPALKKIKEIAKEEIVKPSEIKKSINPEKKVAAKKPEKDKVQKKETVEKVSEKTEEKEIIEKTNKVVQTENTTQKNEELSPKINYQEKIFIDKYASKLREEINKNKNYPTMSKKLHEQGSVIISFRVLKSGKFTNIKVSISSDKERLDKAALNALFDTEEFEPFYKEINKEFLDFNLPIEFKLN
jgi:periplasmic protein TonB